MMTLTLFWLAFLITLVLALRHPLLSMIEIMVKFSCGQLSVWSAFNKKLVCFEGDAWLTNNNNKKNYNASANQSERISPECTKLVQGKPQKMFWLVSAFFQRFPLATCVRVFTAFSCKFIVHSFFFQSFNSALISVSFPVCVPRWFFSYLQNSTPRHKDWCASFDLVEETFVWLLLLHSFLCILAASSLLLKMLPPLNSLR